MKGWHAKTLGEICDHGGGLIQTGPFGSQLHEEDYTNEGIPVVMPADIVDGKISMRRIARIPDSKAHQLRRHFLKRGDIVYGRRGDIGRQAIIRETHEGWLCGTGCLKISLGPNSDVSSRFLHLYLQSSAVIGWIQGQAIGATMPNLNTDILRRIPVYAPTSFATQDKVAAILTAYDDLIDNNESRIVALETMAEGLYHEWFVRLRFPGHQKTKLVNGRPKTWLEKRFGEFCVLQRGFDLPDAEIVPGPYPIIASTSIKGFHHEFKVQPPVVTTGRSGSLGEVLMVDTQAWPLNTSLYVKDFCGNSAFLVYYTLKNMGLEKFNVGAGVPMLNRNHLTGIKLNVPDKALQDHFDQIVGPIHKQSEQLTKINDGLRQTRDLLLPRLFSGKLRVDDLDIQFPPSMTEAPNA